MLSVYRCHSFTRCAARCLQVSVFHYFTLYLVSTSLYILYYPYKCFCSRIFSLPFWDANQLAINASQHPRAKASCFWLSALHFLCWKIFKSSSPCQHFTFCAAKNFQVPHLICTSLSTLRDNDKCLSLSAVHFLCCKIFEESLLVSTSLSVIQDICNSISLSAVQSTCCRVSCLSAVRSACCKILIVVWLPAIHRVPCNIAG